jgi:hypothetical protein
MGAASPDLFRAHLAAGLPGCMTRRLVVKNKRLLALGLILVLVGLSGCAAYYDSINAGNRAMFENPRTARVTLTAVPGKSIENLAGVDIAIPLDAHKVPVVADSPGKQIKEATSNLVLPAVVGILADKMGGGSDKLVDKESTYIEKTTTTNTTTTTTGGRP